MIGNPSGRNATRPPMTFDTAENIGTLLPSMPVQRADSDQRQAGASGWERPDTENARKRAPSRPATNVQAPRNSLPRLHVDASGRIWVAVRSQHPVWWNPIGTVWTEHLASYDGTKWTGPVFLAHSDNLLDNRPAIVSTRGGEVMIIGSTDGRREFHRLGGRAAVQGAVAGADPYNNDLWMNTIALGPASGPVQVTAVTPRKAAPDAEAAAESKTIAMLRGARVEKLRLLRGEFHRHSEVSMDGGNDGTLIDQWRYMLDPAGMDWVGCCDHDNGGGREYSWWITQKLTDIFYSPEKFVPMFSYERSVAYPEGHRNVVFATRGIRTLPRLPKMDNESTGHAPDTAMLYRYLRAFDGVVASHTSGTNMGTDWRDNDPLTEPVVEIYQGDRQNYEMPGAPRSNSAGDSIGGWRPKGFVSLALGMGYKLGFQASSDHISTHLSYCNIYAAAGTREALLDGLKKRHVYGSTDNILADVRSGEHLMGDAFSTSSPPELRVKLVGTAPFAKVHIVKDGKYVYSVSPGTPDVSFAWRDNAAAAGKTSYYYVRGEQANGEVVWVSPMWIEYRAR